MIFGFLFRPPLLVLSNEERPEFWPFFGNGDKDRRYILHTNHHDHWTARKYINYELKVRRGHLLKHSQAVQKLTEDVKVLEAASKLYPEAKPQPHRSMKCRVRGCGMFAQMYFRRIFCHRH